MTLKKYLMLILLIPIFMTSLSAQSTSGELAKPEDALPVGWSYSKKDRSQVKPLPFDSRCSYWWSYIDPRIELPKDTIKRDEKNEQTVIEAIDCFLKLKGNTDQLAVTAVIDIKLGESPISPPTIEVEALYRISAIYYQKWNHASAIVLLKNGRPAQKDAAKVAYKAYKAWFKKVKKIGLEKARKQKLDPLAGSGVRWY